MLLKVAIKANQALTVPVILTASFINWKTSSSAIEFAYEDADTFDSANKDAVCVVDAGDGEISGSSSVIRKLLEVHAAGAGGKLSEQEDEWITRAIHLISPDFKQVETPLFELDAHLTLRSHVVGYSLSAADTTVWGALRGNRAAYGYIKKNQLLNVGRWFRYLEDAYPWLNDAVERLTVQVKEVRAVKAREGASYEIALPDTEKGVVTRFPPEPSGYLHIGHAKAALLNDYFAHEKYHGTLIVRFDDTNPSKETEEFQDAIVEDLQLMGIRPDKTSHTSDYFPQLYDYCVQLIERGKAYADDTEQATMRAQRMDGIASARRDRSVAENLAAFAAMRQGTAEGRQHCIRAKISVDDANKSLRDPVIYRCNAAHHHRTGAQWTIYPTYDFACPVVDSLEGVTHALRTIEYRDRNPQYHWMQAALSLRPVHIWDFARLNFVRTVLSKRKLARFVERGLVTGWDDARFPTVRGIRRRGMTIAALRDFILRQGPSRNIVNLDWTIFWATNKKYIDPVAPRHTAIVTAQAVTATVTGLPPGVSAAFTEPKPRHLKNASLGTKQVAYSASILLEQDDARTFTADEEITLMNWGNAYVRKIHTSSSSSSASPPIVTHLELELHLAGDVKTTDKKITWLSTDPSDATIPVELVDFDFLITKDKLDEHDDLDDFINPHTEFRAAAAADANVAALQPGAIIQFERKGYYRLDRAYRAAAAAKKAPDGHKPDEDEDEQEQAAVFFAIPTGKTGAK
ncbi:MAG: hypothetical protein M1826_002429 [Phylliscum demangeonii]|nr:MAG: hypothetical protein M1826_002429 [Phylliscum demangeonii]